MRQYFFWAMAIFIPTAIGCGLLWTVGKAVVSLFKDWRLGKELDQLERESAARRESKRQSREQRLANGCDHDFGAGAHGIPENACSKCGLERDKPAGLCDHVWRIEQGPVLRSACERCGKTYSAM